VQYVPEMLVTFDRMHLTDYRHLETQVIFYFSDIFGKLLFTLILDSFHQRKLRVQVVLAGQVWEKDLWNSGIVE
jgi:hypothetical protein